MESPHTNQPSSTFTTTKYSTSRTQHQTLNHPIQFFSSSYIDQYRKSISSYKKLFPPQTNLPTIAIQPISHQIKLLPQTTHPRPQTNQEQQQSERQRNRLQGLRQQYTALKRQREKQNENQSTAVNRDRTPVRSAYKSMTETKAKRKVGLEGLIEVYSRPANLEFDLHKQRFFNTFMRRKDEIGGMAKSSEKLRTIRKKLVLE